MSNDKWKVFDIGGDSWAAPDLATAIAECKRQTGMSTNDIEDSEPEEVPEPALSAGIRNEDTGEVDQTMAEARDEAQALGKVLCICTQNC